MARTKLLNKTRRQFNALYNETDEFLNGLVTGPQARLDEIDAQHLKRQILFAEAASDTKKARELRKQLRPIQARIKLRKMGEPFDPLKNITDSVMGR